MFFNSPNDFVVLGSAFFSGVAILIFGAAAYYGIKSAIHEFMHPKTTEQAVRNK